MCSCIFGLFTLFSFVFCRVFFCGSGYCTEQYKDKILSCFNRRMDRYGKKCTIIGGRRMLTLQYNNDFLWSLRNKDLRPNRSTRRAVYWAGIRRKELSYNKPIDVIITLRKNKVRQNINNRSTILS